MHRKDLLAKGYTSGKKFDKKADAEKYSKNLKSKTVISRCPSGMWEVYVLRK